MVLSDELISQFVKVTNDEIKGTKETTHYGTIVQEQKSGKLLVQLDGSNELTPIESTTDYIAGERVTVRIKNHTATITGNLSAPAARNKDVQETGNKITEVENLVADKVSADQLAVEQARIEVLETETATIKGLLSADNAEIGNLISDNVEIKQQLTANKASIDNLSANKLDATVAAATYATIENLDATNAKVYNLESTYGEFEELTTEHFSAVDADIANLQANKADVADANIMKADIKDLNAEVANIDTLIFGSATGDTIQTSFSNSVIAQLGDAQIKSAMIESISADKITAGDIITNNVRVKSEDGSLLISDETMQISDETRVRVQIGKDSSGDYSINIWDQNGNLMFSKGGITDSAIKEAIIRNDMVSDTANIAAHKLDIDSLFEEINGSSNTIKSTQIYLDDEKQTLDVAFKSMSETVEDQGSTISSQGTQIAAVQGQITSKIWQQDINTAKNDMSTQYSTLSQELDSVSATVASNSTAISKKADSTTVTTVSDKVTSLEQNLSGFKTTVSNTYATKEDVDNLVIGGRNILQQSGHWTELPTWWVNNGGGMSLDTTNTYLGYNTLATTLGNGIAGNNYKFFVLDTNKVYTYSALIKSDKDNPGNKAVPLHYHCSTDGTTNDRSVEVIDYDQSLVAGEWKLLYLTFKPLGKYFRPFLYIGSSGDNACNCNIAYIKLEEGNKPTDWSPAPEDMASVVQMNSAIEQKANSITTTVEETITEATKYSLRKATVDLRGDEYDESLYYPVAGSGIPADGYRTFQVNVQLNSYSTPSWSTHDAGFTCNLSARMKAFGWGTAANNMGWIDDFSFGHCDKMPAYIYQMSNASVPVFYLRGGGRYYLYTDYDCTWTIHTSDYTVSSQTVTPTSTPYNYGPLVNNWTDHNDLVSAKSSITQLSDRITANVTETTKLGTRMSTVEQTATGLTAKIDGLKIGGRNLYVKSASFDSDKWINTAGWAKDGVDSNGNVRIKCGTWAGLYQFIEAKTGDVFTLSANILGDGVSNICFYAIMYDTPSASGNVVTGVSPASSSPGLAPLNEQRFHQTFTVTADGYLRIRIENANSGSYIWVSSLKLERGNKPTDWTPAPEDVDSDISDAAKTATNYLNFSSSGLVVGDHTGTSLGKNVLIDSDSVDIRNGSTVMASFGANTITLGQNAENSVIDLCDGAGKITTMISETENSYPAYDSIAIESQRLNLKGKRIYQETTATTSTGNYSGHATVMTSSCGMGAECVVTATGKTHETGIASAVTDNYVNTYSKIYSTGWNTSTSAYVNNTVSIYPLRTQFSQPISINGNTVTGANNVLWTGGYYMTSAHSCTLSEAVYDQTNGIVLVFSEYANGANVNSNWHSFFIPKEMVVLHSGAGFCFQMATSNLAYYATKYLYIGNTKISGHDNNSLVESSTCGIAKTNNRFVLRYVIGV